MARIIDQIKRKGDTRQAVIQLFSPIDLRVETRDLPCTCTLQFLPREGKLHLIATMRSNDVWLGLPHDVFAFTFLQELVARSVGQEVGEYHHSVGSLHLYDGDRERVQRYVREGWQDAVQMPTMPVGDPWSAIRWLLSEEETLRVGQGRGPLNAEGVDPYFSDLARLLRVKAHLADRKGREAVSEMRAMSSQTYATYIRQRVTPQPDLVPALVISESRSAS